MAAPQEKRDALLEVLRAAIDGSLAAMRGAMPEEEGAFADLWRAAMERAGAEGQGRAMRQADRCREEGRLTTLRSAAAGDRRLALVVLMYRGELTLLLRAGPPEFRTESVKVRELQNMESALFLICSSGDSFVSNLEVQAFSFFWKIATPCINVLCPYACSASRVLSFYEPCYERL